MLSSGNRTENFLAATRHQGCVKFLGKPMRKQEMQFSYTVHVHERCNSVVYNVSGSGVLPYNGLVFCTMCNHVEAFIQLHALCNRSQSYLENIVELRCHTFENFKMVQKSEL